jgi:hypothetical protein
LAGTGFRPAGGCGTVADVMTMLRGRAARVVVAGVALVAVGWSVSAPATALTAAGGRADGRAVGFLVHVDGAALRDPQPGLRGLIQRGSQGGWAASTAAELAVAVVIAAAWRRRRSALPATGPRLRGMAAGRACRAPPTLQRA